MKHIIILLAIVLFAYSLRAEIIIEKEHTQPQDNWIDPNTTQDIGEYFRNKNGYLCENIIYQVEVNSLTKPARKCRMPDGAWQTFLIG